MSFISKISARLFKSKSNAKTHPKLTDQLEKLPLEELMAVIQNSKDEQLRNSAVQKIDRLSNLLTLADIHSGKASVSNLQKSAKKRIAQLLDASEITHTEFCKSVTDPIQRFAVLGLMQSQSLADSELAAIVDEAVLTRIVLEATSSRIRQSAAERIQQPEHLFVLFKECKNADKSVYKIIKEKCDRIKAAEKQQQEFVAEQLQLVASLEQHAKHVYDNYYSAKLIYLDQQWSTLLQTKELHIADDLKARAISALQACKEKDGQHRAETEAQENLSKAFAAADQQFMALATQLDEILVSLVHGAATDDQIADQLSSWHIEWNKLSAIKAPNKAFNENISRQLQAIANETKARAEYGTLKEHSFRLEMQINNQAAEAKSYFEALYERIIFLKTYTAHIADVMAIAELACSKFNEQEKSAEEDAKLKLRQFSGLIRKANEALEAGELSKAIGFRNTLEERRAQIASFPSHLIHQLESLDESITKLKDWKSYAVVPKRLELITQMENLVSSTLHPEILAERIKKLQEDWKHLSKGMSDQEQWEKFRQLAQQAYSPCQIYFAEQAALRAENLAQCKKLVEQLNEYLSMLDHKVESEVQAPFDWRAAEQVIRVARQEWRNYTPTERVATQPVLSEFDDSLAKIYQKIVQEHARIAALKQNLIDRTLALTQAEDLRKAIDSVKAQQLEWQSLGVCGHKQEQQLWQAFRHACDQVFAKRQQQSDEFKAELNANHDLAKQLLQQLASIQTLGGKALFDARSQVDEIRKSFSGMGQLPKAVANEIRSQFQSQFHAFDEKLMAERAKEKQQIWINLFEAAEKINHFELGLRNASPNEVDAKASLQTYLNQLTPLPTGGLKALQQKLEKVNAETDLELNAKALRHLCISAELLTELQSPVEDVKFRQEIQVEQLTQSFGKKIHNLRAEMETKTFEWLQVGAVEHSLYALLAARFNLCLMKAIKSSDANGK